MGYKIRELRKKRGMTQVQLGKVAKVSRTIISGLESGKLTITSTKTLENIAKALDCKVGDIFF